MTDNKLPKACWLTINRACNLRCEWCYAQDTLFHGNDMSYDMATALIDMCVSCGIHNYLLIGGEPTIHPSFFDIIQYLNNKKCKITIVTNGILLHKEEFCQNLAKYKENLHISISLKGANDEYYNNHCGAKAYHKVRVAIENCRLFEIPFSISYVISADNVENIVAFANELRSSGVTENISFSFCNETLDTSGEMSDVYSKHHPVMVNHLLSLQYNELNDALNGDFTLHQTYPLCICNDNVLSEMITRKQVSTSCHVHNRSGVIFDTDGSILLCNHFVGYGVGKFGIDYHDTQTFIKFWESSEMLNLHKKLTSMPSLECSSCPKKEFCGGGCCIQWFAHTFDEYKSVYTDIEKSNQSI